MSYYFRHIKEILNSAGVEVTPTNKRHIDQAIYRIVSVDYKDCPSIWKAVEQRLQSSEKKQESTDKLKNAAV